MLMMAETVERLFIGIGFLAFVLILVLFYTRKLCSTRKSKTSSTPSPGAVAAI